MQITFGRNPKTVGWARRVAITLLIGSAVFVGSVALAFFLLLNHNNRVTPNDPQNMLGALTVGMLVGAIAAAIATAASLVVSSFFGFYKPGNKAVPPAVVS